MMKIQAAKWVVAGLLNAMLVWPAFAQTPEPSELLDRVVAVVNDDVILLSELQTELRYIKQQLRQRDIELPPEDVLIKQLLERLIIERLQLQEAAASGIQVDDVMLNEALRNIARQNGMTLEELRQKIIKDGEDYLEYRENVRKQIMITQLRQREVGGRVMITDQEIDDYLSNEQIQGDQEVQYLVGHIMISIPEAAKPEVIQTAKRRIEVIYEELQKGADFAQVALRESEGQAALEGGSLGWRSLNQLPSLFAKNLLTLKRGEFSKPIRSPSGFHILKLDDKKGDTRHVVAQTHARHILVQTNAVLDDEGARQKLLKLRERVQQGEDFSTLAKAHSEDPGSAVNGGDLGWAPPEIYAEQFRKVIENLPVNKISEPFKTQFGWHIVEVLGRRDHDDTDEYRRNLARRDIFERKAAEEEQLWVRRLRDQAYIDYRLDDDA